MPKKRTTRPARSTPAPSARPDARASTRLPLETFFRYFVLAVVAGVLWFLSCADFDIAPLAWIAMVPTLWIADRVHTTRQAFFFGWITGVVGNGGGFYWISGLLVRFGHMPWIAATAIFLLLAAYQGIVFGAFAAVTRSIRKQTQLPAALVAPIVIVAFELAIPMIFPFSVAITQAWQPHVIQVADLVGTSGVAALLLMVNGAVYDVALATPRVWKPALVAAAVLLSALAYGHARIRQIDRLRAAAPTIDVGVVQPNVSFDMKGRNRARYASGQIDDLRSHTRALEQLGAQLVVWPETAYPYGLGRLRTHDYGERDPRRIRDGYSVPVMFGALTFTQTERYNTALLVERDGEFTAHSDKKFLMLFGEYTPGRSTFPFIARIMPAATGQLTPGTEVHTLPFRTPDGRTWQIGPMICYEDILASFGRTLAPMHPNLLVNITNDSWFGDTSEPWEHLALSVYRAVEMRTDLVRSVNTGVSAFVDAAGRVYAKTYAVNPAVDPRGADHIHARVALLDGGHTLYAAIGDVFAYLCALATAYLWLLRAWIRKRAEAAAA